MFFATKALQFKPCSLYNNLSTHTMTSLTNTISYNASKSDQYCLNMVAFCSCFLYTLWSFAVFTCTRCAQQYLLPVTLCTTHMRDCNCSFKPSPLSDDATPHCLLHVHSYIRAHLSHTRLLTLPRTIQKKVNTDCNQCILHHCE